jgi:outer membrane receptor protein involved in Fe transport
MLKKSVLFIFSLLTIHFLGAQTALVVGKVLSDDGKPLADATVIFNEGNYSSTDVDGQFKSTLQVGSSQYICIAKGYDTLTENFDVQIENNFLTIILSNTQKMKGVDISTKKKVKANTVTMAIETKKMAPGMVEAISAEDFQKTSIRTTSDALKRIPGATIMDGKFANIRGMFDRYNAGYLNGAPLPSTESDRKAFSFDIIPAALLDNIIVVKSATPDMIGDFGGGIIKINTKSIPEKLSQSVSIGFQYNSITTLKDVQTFSMLGSEYMGIPASEHKIPVLNSMKPGASAAVNIEETKKFNNDWSIQTMKPMLSPRFSYSVGKPFKIGKKELGFLVSVNYALTQKYSRGLVENRDYGTNYVYKSFNDDVYGTNVQNGGIANLSFKINNKNRIDFRNLLSLTYDANTTVREGVSDKDNDMYSQAYSNMVSFNRLVSSQLNGTHSFGENKHSLNWVMNYGNTNREIPDFRIANYALPGNIDRQLVINPFFNTGTGRFFSNLDENTYSASADYSYTMKLAKMTNIFKTGAYYQGRNRTFLSRQFVYGPLGTSLYSNNMPEIDLATSKLSENSLFLSEIDVTDKGEYDAFSKLGAAYVMVENHVPLFVKETKTYSIKFIYGIRYESFEQELDNAYFRKLSGITGVTRKMASPGVNSDWLPSINVSVPLSDKMTVRAAAYKTLNRPELRELAPFAFYNFNINSEILGNNKLQRATIDNYDVRWEFFGKKEDMISIGGFYKRITNPIEFSLDPTQPLIRTFTYQNERIADNYGIEIEARKNLGKLVVYTGLNFFKDLTFYGNLSLIKSEIKFGQNSNGVISRPLQGQSPYVINLSLFYENKSGFQVNTSFNKIGQRIAYIGVPQSVQRYGADIYEYGRSVWDLQFGKKVGKKGLVKLTIGDILAQKNVFYQDLDQNGALSDTEYNETTKTGDNVLFSFTNGTTITLNYSITF